MVLWLTAWCENCEPLSGLNPLPLVAGYSHRVAWSYFLANSAIVSPITAGVRLVAATSHFVKSAHQPLARATRVVVDTNNLPVTFAPATTRAQQEYCSRLKQHFARLAAVTAVVMKRHGYWLATSPHPHHNQQQHRRDETCSKLPKLYLLRAPLEFFF